MTKYLSGTFALFGTSFRTKLAGPSESSNRTRHFSHTVHHLNRRCALDFECICGVSIFFLILSRYLELKFCFFNVCRVFSTHWGYLLGQNLSGFSLFMCDLTQIVLFSTKIVLFYPSQRVYTWQSSKVFASRKYISPFQKLCVPSFRQLWFDFKVWIHTALLTLHLSTRAYLTLSVVN